jgi:2-haloacid dehalogenase
VTPLRALVFDVFGTVVDWHSSMTDELARVAGGRVSADWAEVARAWRRRYRPTLDRVRNGELPWQPLDALHRLMLDEVVAEFGLESLGEDERAELVRGWHRLRPWPDTVPGMTRLHDRYILSTLSNGGVGLLVRLARAGGLPFDCVLTPELIRTYKPDPRVYRMAADLLDVPAGELLMVACHPDDLRAAAEVGLRTAYVPRPLEWGPGHQAPPPPAGVDLVAHDLEDLARRLLV